MIANQTTLALAAAEALTDDRRKLTVVGGPSAISALKADAGALWKAVPSCFRPSDPTIQIVGSFDGVPVAELDASLKSPPGLSLQLDGRHIGGVIIDSPFGCRSYHKRGEEIIEHPRAAS